MDRSGDLWILLVFGRTGYRITLRHRWTRDTIRCSVPPPLPGGIYLDTRNNLGPSGGEHDAEACLGPVTSGLTILQPRMGPRRFLRRVCLLGPLDLEHRTEFIRSDALAHILHVILQRIPLTVHAPRKWGRVVCASPCSVLKRPP